MCFARQWRALYRNLNLQKWSEHVVYCNVVHFDLETQRRALFRHLNIQKWSEPGVFCTFWLGHALQWRALFRHLNFQKWSEPVLFCTFWLGNVLRATTACPFSTFQLPKVVRGCCALYILTWTCASHHNGVQFFVSHLARWLRTRRFSKPTFPPSGATIHWKNTVNRDLPTFSRPRIFISSHLCFSICPYCRKFDF